MFLNLPYELFEKIIRELSDSDLYFLKFVCKGCYRLIEHGQPKVNVLVSEIFNRNHNRVHYLIDRCFGCNLTDCPYHYQVATMALKAGDEIMYQYLKDKAPPPHNENFYHAVGTFGSIRIYDDARLNDEEYLYILLKAAVQARHIDLINHIIDTLEIEGYEGNQYLGYLMKCSLSAGHYDIYLDLTKKMTEDLYLDHDALQMAATAAGLLDFIKDSGPLLQPDMILLNACKHGRVNVIEYIFCEYRYDHEILFKALMLTIATDQPQAFSLILNKIGETEPPKKIYDHAIFVGHIKYVESLCAHFNPDLRHLIFRAFEYARVHILDYLLSKCEGGIIDSSNIEMNMFNIRLPKIGDYVKIKNMLVNMDAKYKICPRVYVLLLEDFIREGIEDRDLFDYLYDNITINLRRGLNVQRSDALCIYYLYERNPDDYYAIFVNYAINNNYPMFLSLLKNYPKETIIYSLERSSKTPKGAYRQAIIDIIYLGDQTQYEANVYSKHLEKNGDYDFSLDMNDLYYI